jgi:hypothetical protein
LNLARTRSTLVDRIVRLVNGKKRVTCQHCLWTARIVWDEEDDFAPSKPAQQTLRLVHLPGIQREKVASSKR